MLGITKFLDLPIPSFINSDSAKYLTGGQTTADLPSSLNLNGFINGTLQDAIEGSINEYVPAKKAALLTNAALERSSIQASAEIVNENTYESFYGSYIFYNANADALCQDAMLASDSITASLTKFGEGLNSVALKFPNKKFCVIVADNSNTSIANPVTNLTNESFTTEDANAILQEACTGDNINIVDVACTSPEDYYSLYYKSDHHWNGWGAMNAFLKSVETLDDETSINEIKDSFKNVGDLRGLEWLRENGSLSRDALMLMNEPVNEPYLDFSSIYVLEGEVPLALEPDGIKDLRSVGDIASFDFYQTWYGNWYNTQAINSSASLPHNSATIICDSFGTAFKWMASLSFGIVCTKYDMHDSQPSDQIIPISETIVQNNSDIVFIVGRTSSFINVVNRSPNYFE